MTAVGKKSSMFSPACELLSDNCLSVAEALGTRWGWGGEVFGHGLLQIITESRKLGYVSGLSSWNVEGSGLRYVYDV